MSRTTWVARLALVLALAGATGCDTVGELDAEGGGEQDAGSGGSGTSPSDVPDGVLAISGEVLDGVTLLPVPGATVTTNPALGEVVTNSQGEYVFTGSAGVAIQVGAQYAVTASHADYKPNVAYVTIKAGHNRHVDIMLSK